MSEKYENLTSIAAPQGYVVSFEDPSRKGDIFGYVATSIGMSLSVVFLSIRIYTKIRIARDFSFDDLLLIFSWCLGLAVQAISLHLWFINAVGVHAWEMPFQRYLYYNKMIVVASVLYVPSLACAKLSLLLLYRKLSDEKTCKICTYILMATVLGYSIGIVFALIFPCHTIAASWNPSIKSDDCVSRTGIYFAIAAVNIATDFLILALPLPMVSRLTVSRRKKIGMVVIFVIGSATFVTSIIRVMMMVPMADTIDYSWAVSIPCVWINIEANLVIICVSLPSFRPFLRHVAPRWMEDDDVGEQKFNSICLKRDSETRIFGHDSESSRQDSPWRMSIIEAVNQQESVDRGTGDLVQGDEDENKNDNVESTARSIRFAEAGCRGLRM